MSKHRSLSLATFVTAVPEDLFVRYYAQLNIENQPEGWELLNPQAMEAFLNEPENGEAVGGIKEDFKRINDICGRSMDLVVRAYEKYGLNVSRPEATAQELAMRLFLDHREAFEYAWSRYLLYNCSGSLSRHRMPLNGHQIGASEIAEFRTDISAWLARRAQGSECEVHWFEDAGETLIRVSRGTYLRTVACWEGKRIDFVTYRPAAEDLLIYDSASSLLSIRANNQKERSQYLWAFATFIAKDASLAEAAAKQQVFSLLPLQDGRFDYAGNAVISSIKLVRARLKLYDRSSSFIDVKSEDVARGTLGDGRLGLSLGSGELQLAQLRFTLRPQGETPKAITFQIEPPARTDLTQKRYADIIERYLLEQGVKVL